MLFYTISDFLAYGNLGGYNVRGNFPCPICEENMSYIQLKHGKGPCTLCIKSYFLVVILTVE